MIIVRYRTGGYDPNQPHDNAAEAWDLTTYRRYGEDGQVVEERPVTLAEYSVALARYQEVIAPAVAKDWLFRRALVSRDRLTQIVTAAEQLAAVPAPSADQLVAQIPQIVAGLGEIAKTLRTVVSRLIEMETGDPSYLVEDVADVVPPPPPPPDPAASEPAPAGPPSPQGPPEQP